MWTSFHWQVVEIKSGRQFSTLASYFWHLLWKKSIKAEKSCEFDF